MANTSKTSSTASNRLPKSLGHYVNKIFRHHKKSTGSSSVSMVSEPSSIILEAPDARELIEENTVFPNRSQTQTNVQINHEAVIDVTNETNSLETTLINNLEDAIDEGEIYYGYNEPMDYIQFLPIAKEKRYKGQQFSIEELPKFCEKLHGLVEIVRNVQDDSSLYPRQLQTVLEKEAKELGILYSEIKCIHTTIERVQKQRNLIKTGKDEALEQLNRLEDEEVREIEKSINIRDIPLFKSWERTKRCRTPESFEKLLNDVHRNQEALNNLKVLIDIRKKKVNYFKRKSKDDSALVSAIATGHPASSNQKPSIHFGTDEKTEQDSN